MWADVPDIIICNANLVSSRNVQMHKLKTMTEYYDIIDNNIRCEECSVVEKLYIKELQSELKRVHGYFQYLGNRKARLAGHTLNDLFLSCEIKIHFGSGIIKKIKCKDIILQMTLPRYFNCYILQGINLVNMYPTVEEISLVMFLDSDFETMDSITVAEDIGLLITVIKENTFPIISHTPVRIPPGTHSVMSFRKTYRKALGPPYGMCGEKKLQFYNSQEILPFTYEYSPTLCVMDYILHDIRNICRCDYAEFYLFWGNQPVYKTQLPFCQDASQGEQFVIEMDRCIKHLAQGRPDCKSPCHLLLYDLTSSYTAWPLTRFNMDFYDKYIRNKPYSNKLSQELFIVNNNKSSNVTNIDFMRASSFIGNNFVKFYFIFKSLTYTLIAEQPTITRSSLASQLGGTLNLFSGITIIFFVEILELLWRLCTRLVCGTRGKEEGKGTSQLPTEAGEQNSISMAEKEAVPEIQINNNEIKLYNDYIIHIDAKSVHPNIDNSTK